MQHDQNDPQITRRRFVKRSAALAMASTIPGLSETGAAGKRDVVPRIRRAVKY